MCRIWHRIFHLNKEKNWQNSQSTEEHSHYRPLSPKVIQALTLQKFGQSCTIRRNCFFESWEWTVTYEFWHTITIVGIVWLAKLDYDRWGECGMLPVLQRLGVAYSFFNVLYGASTRNVEITRLTYVGRPEHVACSFLPTYRTFMQ